MRHLNALRIVLAAGILLVIAGCSPSQRDGKQAIESRIKEESQGRIKLTKFQKNNGAQGELMGFKIYALEFEAEIEFTEQCKWVTGFQGSQLSFRTDKPVAESQSGFTWKKFLDDTQSPGEMVTKGQKVGISGVVRFVKKEKGWSVEAVDLKNSTPVTGSVSRPATANPAPEARAGLTAQEKLVEAERGNANAQYELGKMYAHGDGVEKDAVQAVKWFRKSAEQGFAKGQNGLGVQYLIGQGVSQDFAEAFRWIRKAADQGEPKALVNLGDMYRRGDGVSQDPNESARLFRKAAESGSIDGQFFLGLAYANGQGVHEDKSEAAIWFRKAAEAGDSKGQFELGEAYANGSGVAQNASEAAIWIKKAADQGLPAAQFKLAEMYDEGRGVVQNRNAANDWYRKVSEQYRKDAVEGNSRAQLRLAEMYETGRGVPQNLTTAVEWYRKVATSDNRYASDLANKKIRELSTDPVDVANRQSRVCVSNLKQIGLALRMWSNDNMENFPFNLTTNKGGTMEFCSRRGDGFDENAYLHFMVASNELNSGKILVCPADSAKRVAKDLQSLLPANVTYQLRSGKNVDEVNQGEILGRCPIHGHLLFCDGSVKVGEKK